MKKILLSFVCGALVLSLFGCSASKTYTEEDIEKAYNKGYKQGVSDASDEASWRASLAWDILLDVADEQVISGLGPIYGRLYESDTSQSLDVTEKALETIQTKVREAMGYIGGIDKAIKTLEPK